MKKAMFALLMLTIFLGGCSGRTETPKVISFPEEIGDYALEDRKDEPTRCETFEKGMTDVEGNVLDIEGQVCTRSTVLRYVDEATDKVIFVTLNRFMAGEDVQKKLLGEIYPSLYPGLIRPVEGTNVFRLEKHEFFWFTDSEEFGQVFIQEGEKSDNPDGSRSYMYPYTADISNDVTNYFLGRYPAVEW